MYLNYLKSTSRDRESAQDVFIFAPKMQPIKCSGLQCYKMVKPIILSKIYLLYFQNLYIFKFMFIFDN